MLTVTLDDSGKNNEVVLRCRGRLVRGDETGILCGAIGHAGQNVILDLAGVDAIDAAGIGALVSLQAAGIYLTLRNPTEPVREVLRITKLESVFEIEIENANEIQNREGIENRESRSGEEEMAAIAAKM
ncbi:MAG: STAS domain-containing protein [Terriglobales bacterium]